MKDIDQTACGNTTDSADGSQLRVIATQKKN